MSTAAAIVGALPWVLVPVVALVRAARSRSLDDESDAAPADAPLVSVIVPARNERRNIERCVRSVLSTTYPHVEVIVVDDHSDDGTGDLARAIAAHDPRLCVIDSPPLAQGWFGKQWACVCGARLARGELLCFIDADTTHAPDLLARTVNAMRARGADLLSVLGHQEMHSFWERVVQPYVFSILLVRYGSTEAVSHASRPADAIASGQFILISRAAYYATGGHQAVKDLVAEDMAMAQRFVRLGRRIALVMGDAQLATHMYESLGELLAGWGKNMYAAGRHGMRGGRLGRALYPAILVGTPLFGLAPVVALALGLSGMLSPAWTLWGAIGVGAALVWWALVYRAMRQPAWYAPLFPLGALVVAYIAVVALARGPRVAWKGREYLAR